MTGQLPVTPITRLFRGPFERPLRPLMASTLVGSLLFFKDLPELQIPQPRQFLVQLSFTMQPFHWSALIHRSRMSP